MDPASDHRNLMNSMQNLMHPLRKLVHTTTSLLEALKGWFRTIKQIMTKNSDDAWLTMLIFRATDISGINKSPSEILNGRKYRTGLPMIDIHKKSTEDQIEKLSEKCLKMTNNGKELARLPIGTKVLYEQNPNLDKNKRLKWCKGTIKIGPTQESMKFGQIMIKL